MMRMSQQNIGSTFRKKSASSVIDKGIMPDGNANWTNHAYGGVLSGDFELIFQLGDRSSLTLPNIICGIIEISTTPSDDTSQFSLPICSFYCHSGTDEIRSYESGSIVNTETPFPEQTTLIMIKRESSTITYEIDTGSGFSIVHTSAVTNTNDMQVYITFAGAGSARWNTTYAIELPSINSVDMEEGDFTLNNADIFEQ